jgi:hypothetical protein
MQKISIELSDEYIISNSGLLTIGKYLNETKIFAKVNRVSKIKKNIGIISDYDIVKSIIALICIGKPNYDSIEEFRNNKFFKRALNIKKVPSAPTLRQRIESFDADFCEVLREINADILKLNFSKETKRINDVDYMVIDSDVTPMDNSKTKKEGVELTYKKIFGFAPIMSYAGESGFMLNNELRNGSAHSNCEGTIEYFTQTVELARLISESPIFAILDSGNDDCKLVEFFDKNDVEFLIKRNLRNENRKQYIDRCKASAEKVVTLYPGCKKYYSRSVRKVGDKEIPIAIVVTERLNDEHGQLFFSEECEVEVYWNSLNLPADEAEARYHEHGTMEQYHAEFKSELDLERLPSKSFQTNYTIMLLGMLSFNLLRIIGKDLLKTGMLGGKRIKSKRLRLKTVMQNIMYMAGHLVSHARKSVLRIFKENVWAPAFQKINFTKEIIFARE